MQFPFSYQIEVGGVAVATIDGVALIGVEDDGNDWRLAGIMCDRLGEPSPRGGHLVFMPKTHWLYARIASALINQSRNEIDTAWLAWTASNIRAVSA